MPNIIKKVEEIIKDMMISALRVLSFYVERPALQAIPRYVGKRFNKATPFSNK